MTLYEALEDIGKGRIIEVGGGCELYLAALAKGRYTMKNYWHGKEKTVILTGTPGENARTIEKAYYDFLRENPVIDFDGGIYIEYSKH